MACDEKSTINGGPYAQLERRINIHLRLLSNSVGNKGSSVLYVQLLDISMDGTCEETISKSFLYRLARSSKMHLRLTTRFISDEFGSIAHMETKDLFEMACGLCDSNQSFLWVIRPDSIPGSESLPEEVSKMVSERGYIVKWAPQNDVLAHPSVGGFWSHCGWNSTLESIVEGVPMICRPFNGEQKLNALYIQSVWRTGIQLEGEVERGSVERAVKMLIMDDEGANMRERALVLKEKLKAAVRSGGSPYNALDEFVNYLVTE